MIGSVSVRNRFLTIAKLTALFLLPMTLTGCGQPKGKVSGQVLFQGKPLPGGIVKFRPVNSALNPVTAQIDENGKYEAAVPAGECKISVDNRGLLSEGGGPV